MSDEKLIASGRAPVPAEHRGAPAPAYPGDSYYPALEQEESGIDLRRYLFGVLRYKWLLVVGLVIGLAGAFVAWNMVEVQYTAEGSLWIEQENRNAPGDVAPVRTSGLLESGGWIELLRSYQVLDSVAIAEKLYVRPPSEYKAPFAAFALAPRVMTGDFELSIGPDGQEYVLTTAEGVEVDRGQLGGPVGEDVGFNWTPPVGSFEAGATVPFTVMTPRQAAMDLSQRLDARMGGNGNFLRILLKGSDPERLASTVNSLMHRHVELAADLKGAKLDQTLEILEGQLAITERDLDDAERRLEEFRVATITLPTDQVPIAPGLQETRGPVFSQFFNMSMQLEDIQRDRQRLEAALQEMQDGGEVRIEALEVIPAVGSSSELRRILDDLVNARSELRVYRDRYADDYPPIQEILRQIETIQTRAVPEVVRGILAELTDQETDLQARIDANSRELQAIPPRTIEEGRLERLASTATMLEQNLRGRVETARLAAASAIPDVSILDEAQVPQRPSQDQRLPLAAMILFGCLGAAVGGAILLDRTDARFRYASDVSRDIGLDILGSIPRIESGGGRKGVLNAAQALEAFRELRIHIGFAYGSAGPITLAISSPSAGEGKSLISSNIAVAFAEVGQRTLLIDGDTRRGDAHRLVAREQSPGLTDYLRERSGQEIIQKTDHDNLDFIGCGSRGTTTPELLASSRMAYFMGTLKRSYDVIIVDSPPLAAGGDALILSTLTGNLAVVIRTGTTERALAQAKLDQLSRLPIRILGAVLNDVDPSDGYHYYYTAYLPGYEAVREEGDQEEGLQLISGTET